MAEEYTKPYLDSSVFIGWIKGEVIKGTDRGKMGKHILSLAQEGKFSIYTSTLTLAEVHKKRNQQKLTDPEDERTLAFFEHDFIKLIDVDRRVAEHANQLCREHGIYPNDGIHLASALRAECDVLLAWDVDFAKITRPDIRIEEPQLVGQQKLDLGPPGVGV